MSRKADPIVAVLRYFEQAELALVLQGLALAKEIVRRRTPSAVVKKRLRKGPNHPATITAAATTMTTTPVPPPASRLPRRRKLKDVALPGIGDGGPGPVAQVGD